MKFYYPDHINPTVTIDLPGELLPVIREFKRWQNIGISEDGSIKVFDRGVEEIFFLISLGPLTESKMQELEDFLRTTVKFRLNPFEIETQDGIFKVRFWDEVFKKEERVYQKYWVKFRLRKEI